MKKKLTIIILAAIVIIVGGFLGIKSFLHLDITATKQSEILSQSSEDDTSWKRVDEGKVIIENKNYTLQLDCETTHFTVTDKASGKAYTSVPQQTDALMSDAEYRSEVVITYYDNNSTVATMNTCENSVEGQSFEIKTDGDTIRVYYSIQKSKEKIFVPTVIGQKAFEEDVLAKLQSGPKRRLSGFYTLYQSETKGADIKEMKSMYPALNEENLYILNDTAGEHTYSEITGYFDRAGYNQKAYAKEAERLGLDSSVSENMPAAFMIPVEYALTENGFTTTVLTDRFTSDSDSYKLTNVELLPYFASCGHTETGWYMVPDGSGAIIELAEKAGNTYSQNIWGNDMAVTSSVKANLIQNAGMPVFGFHNGESAFFAVISGGAAVSKVTAEVYGNEFLQNHIYADFNVLAYDSSDMGALNNKAAFNLYATDYVAEFPQVTYMLLSQKETTYSDMAKSYRDYLIQNDVLTEKLTETENVPVYVDFTGYETTEESILGISVDAKTSLSTIEDIQKAMKELQSRDVEGLHIRLKSYANSGIYSKVSNGFDIDKCVGTVKELDELASTLDKNDGKLYLENNISTVYAAGNSFKKMTHAVRNLRKTIANGIDYDLVARTNIEAVNKYYMTSPAYFLSLTDNFVSTLEKKSDNISLYGYSWSDFGSKLWSDFNQNDCYDRAQSAAEAIKAVEKVEDVFGSIITDGSNSYVLAQADAILNIPLSNSALNSESYSIPFYQMVIHGYRDYSGAPMNTSSDTNKTYLASIESGANLYYSFYTSEDNPLKETEAGTLVYPTLITSAYERVEEEYGEFNQLFKELRCQLIASHRRVSSEVFVTVYEDGTEIAVNYGESDYELNGKKVPANGFATWKGGDK